MARSNTNSSGPDGWVRRSERATRRPDRLGALVHHDAVTQELGQTTQSSTGRPAQIAQQQAGRSLPRLVINYCGRQDIEIWNPDNFPQALPQPAYQNQNIGLGNTGPFYLPPLKSTTPQCEPTITDPQCASAVTDSECESTATEPNGRSSNHIQSESSQGDTAPLSDKFTQHYETLLGRLAEERERRLQENALPEESDDDSLDKWCWCRRGDVDDCGSVKCDNPDCSIGWYHQGCLNRRDKSVYAKYGQYFDCW